MAIIAVPADKRTAEVAAALDLANSDVHRPLGRRYVTWTEIDRSRALLQSDMDVLIMAAIGRGPQLRLGRSTPCSSTRNDPALTFATWHLRHQYLAITRHRCVGRP